MAQLIAMTAKPDYLSCFPAGAEEVLVSTDEDGTRRYEYRLNGELVGTCAHFTDGEIWATAIKHGERHGSERFWSRPGVLEFEEYYEHGKSHGTARQWADDGTLIGVYHMEYGAGVELWRDNLTSALREERHWRDGRIEGFVRWWNGDDRTIREEHHYFNGQEHGIAREWNDRGRLRRGLPRYYIQGERVSRRKYLRACETDPTLPQFQEEDNRPERPLPRAYLDQVAQGIGRWR